MNHHTAIFDRDGVLTYFDPVLINRQLAPLLPISVQALVLRWDAWGDTHGFPVSPEEEHELVQAFWRNIGSDYELAPAALDKLLALDYTLLMRPYPDARPALEYIRSQGLKIGVLSNFSLASLEKSLTAVGLDDLVDEACAASVIGASKPASESYLTILERLGVSPAGSLFFDDEEGCVNGALRVGMDAFLVARQPGRIKSHENMNVVDDLSGLRNLISSIKG